MPAVVAAVASVVDPVASVVEPVPVVETVVAGAIPTPTLVDAPWAAAGAPIVGSAASNPVASGALMPPSALSTLAEPASTKRICSGGGHHHAHLSRDPLDALLVRQPGDAGAQQLILGLQGRGALERAADPGVELEDLHLHGHDARQQDPEQRDPDATADDAVEQGVIGQRADVGRRASAPRRLGAGRARARARRAQRGPGARVGASTVAVRAAAVPAAGPDTRRGARGVTWRRTSGRCPAPRAAEGREGRSVPDFFVLPRAAGVSADGVMSE